MSWTSTSPKGVSLVRDGKGRKDRFVPVLGRAASALDAYLADVRPEIVKHATEAALFPSRFGRRLSKAGLGLVVERHATTQLYTRVGVEDLREVLMHAHPRERSRCDRWGL